MEADTEFITKNNIPVIRRISGGGAVYHDKGNLNFTFILQSEKGHQVDFRKYTRPVIEFLATLGIDAVFGSKNDLLVNGLKISGNAEHIFRERVLHHGTLLFDSDIERLRGSLRKDTSCYVTRAVRSNPSKVMNLKQILPGIKDLDDFREKMYCCFINRPGNNDTELTNDEISEAESLAGSKFRTWEWNYAYGPEYYFDNRFIFADSEHSVRIYVKDGIIKECDIEGSDMMKQPGRSLTGCRHMPEDIIECFRKQNLTFNMKNILNIFF